MMNYETVDHIIWECSRFEDERRQRKYKRGNTNPGSLRASEVGSIEVKPQVPKGMWPENMNEPFFLFCFQNHRTLNGLMLEVQRKLESSYKKKTFYWLSHRQFFMNDTYIRRPWVYHCISTSEVIGYI
jgi:hypothetical protein